MPSHLLFQRKGTAGFVRDRAKRIVIPLVVGWVFFGPMAMALVYMTLAPQVTSAPAAPPQGGFPLAHLWFLYYLLLLYGATLALRSCLVHALDRDGRGALASTVGCARSFVGMRRRCYSRHRSRFACTFATYSSVTF